MATPDRYQVTDSVPKPNSHFVVLDIVNDFSARYALRFLVRAYRLARRDVMADELERALNDTDAAHRALYAQPVAGPVKRGRPRKGEYRPPVGKP